ncbi:D-alanine--D-alanine ligase family protein [Oscillospiraceae bacterium MB08-C2-2]|nr:D-alanine--D-alanine ligase family protein [Oscillospiraceae bacterium MB08-C2-2]
MSVKLCVLFGGVSSEHEVSRISAASVLENLHRDRYELTVLGITRDGRWLHYTGPAQLIAEDKWEAPEYTAPAILSPDRSHGGLLVKKETGWENLSVDVVFPVLHGKNGEDGTIQGLLALSGIPCVGCGVLSSAMCMDKAIAHSVLQAAGVPKAKLLALYEDEAQDMQAVEARFARELGYPLFIKPANAGSSVGITKAHNPAELEAALKAAFVHDRKIVAEEAIAGKEVECAIMGNRSPVAAQVLGEIAPVKEFYDYEAKYVDGTTELHIPARIDEVTAQRVRKTAVQAYQALECAGLARVDFFVQADGKIILNEINTLPGFTSISMYPKLFTASGVAYSDLIDRLIEYALKG